MAPCLFVLMLLTLSHALGADDSSGTNGVSMVRTVMDDYENFYSTDRLIRLGLGFGVGAVLANTTADKQVATWYQNDLRSKESDHVARVAKDFGEGKYLIPLSLLSAGVTYINADSSIGHWGAYTFRSYLTGAPAMLLMQKATGGSRPGETSHDSHWRPLNDNNGVSGHAFMGAVPFIVIAHMNNDNKWVKYLAYTASLAAGWSRINDNAHYLSQVALGWYMADESVGAIFDTNEEHRKLAIGPYVNADSYGIALNMVW